MPTLEAWPPCAWKINGMTVLTGCVLLCLSGCTPALIDQQDHGLSVKQALEAQRLRTLPRTAPNAPPPPAASELKPAYDRYLVPPASSSFTPQLP